MTTPGPSNGELGELLWRASEDEHDHRRRALARASRAAWSWPVEARDLAEAGEPLTSLHGVGPWVAGLLEGWLEHPPARVTFEPARQGFLTMAEVRRTLDADPSWEATPHADLQVHSTDSDGKHPLAEIASAARALGRTFIASTDHSQSLTIANGMDEARLAAHNAEVDRVNTEIGDGFRVLRSIEMDVFDDGSGDMDPVALATLDLVLGAFHSKLRVTEDRTERYLAALRNPTVHVLAHPKARMYGRRVGLTADWPRVFEEAARLGKAVEIDATPARQDLSVELATVAVAAGVRWFSIGSDAHVEAELSSLPVGLAIASLAGVPRDRVLNYRTADEVVDWAGALAGA